jgi:hypothetical protein
MLRGHTSALLSCLLAAAPAWAEPSEVVVKTGPRTAEAPVFDLYVAERPTVMITTDLRASGRHARPRMSRRDRLRLLSHTRLELDVQLLPYGCNTHFETRELVADVQPTGTSGGQNQALQVRFGAMWPVGAGTDCTPVHARASRLTLPLLDQAPPPGLSVQRRTYTFPGPPAARRGPTERWVLVVDVHVDEGMARIVELDRVSGPPDALQDFRQDLSCGPWRSGDAATRAGDVKLSLVVEDEDRRLEVRGVAPGLFGDRTPVELVAPAQGDGFRSALGADGEISLHLEQADMGWMAPYVEVLVRRHDGHMGVLACETRTVTPAP